MKIKHLSLFSLLALGCAAQAQVAHYDMSLQDGQITEILSGRKARVASQLPAFTVDGLDGAALRFDGYSNMVSASLPVATFNAEKLTISVLLAPEGYPMMNVNEAENVPTYALVCGNLIDTDSEKSGFSFELSSQGDLRFRFASQNGFLYAIDGDKKLPRGQWSRLTAVLDKSGNKASLYLNDQLIGSTKMSRTGILVGSETFRIGKGAEEKKAFGANINTFCGLIDDIVCYNEVMSEAQVKALCTQFPDYDAQHSAFTVLPDFVYPASRYQQGNAALWRPQFHGMPSGGWTNESHGMAWSDGKYHVFFQKNANGPYMARLHWGHISSENLYKWEEEPIAFGPDAAYDIKGCWSGCVFTDGEITAGKPAALYTAVDNAKATIALASPTDEALLSWEKSAQNPLINGRPQGLSDDFRDPYFFTAGGQKYIIVGTSKNGLGACTLHHYNNGTWSNDGSIFFQATNAREQGTFWEMPNVTDMGDGRYLFTCTPLGIGVGVRTLCWVGTIGADGKFSPLSSTPQTLEVGGVSRDGYGLLSPTIFQKDNKTILLGIVPDKLPTEQNLQIGWAHNYSLPRELSLAADGSLVQKPYSGLTAMRTDECYSATEAVQGAVSLAPVSGRQIELLADFTVGTSAFGFHFLKSGSQQATLTYQPSTNQLELDLTALQRVVNDGAYGGKYALSLPAKPAAGTTLRLHVFLDGSIADIFVADKWAFSVRLFPTDAAAVEAEVFAESTTTVDVKAWVLDANRSTGIFDVKDSKHNGAEADNAMYDLSGRKCSGSRCRQGVYIQQGKKVLAQ